MVNIENERSKVCGQDEADEEREDVQPSCHHSVEERKKREQHQDEDEKNEKQDDTQSPDSKRETKVPEPSQTVSI